MQLREKFLDSINMIIFADYMGYNSDLLTYAEACFYNKQTLSNVQQAVFKVEASFLLHKMLRDYEYEELRDMMAEYYDLASDYFENGGGGADDLNEYVTYYTNLPNTSPSERDDLPF